MKKYSSEILRKSSARLVCTAFLLLPVLFSLSQTANPCPTKNLSNHPGTWKPFNPNEGSAHIKAKPGSYDKAIASANLDKLLSLAKKAYPTPMGGIASFTKRLDFSKPDEYSPFGYELQIGHSGFVCSVGDKIAETFETGTSLDFGINQYESFVHTITALEVPGTDHRIGAINSSDVSYAINGQRVFLIPENFVSSNGWMDHYTEEVPRDVEPRRQWYIIRRENEPLFRYVTRKEYLIQLREELKEYRDIYIRQIEDGFKKYPESYRQTYEGLDGYRQRVEKAIKRVDEYLNNKSGEDLGKTVSDIFHYEALIYSEDSELRFREDRFHMAYFNEKYLDKKLPLHIPQFIIVFLSGPAHDKTGSDAWKYNFRIKMMQGLDFKAMLEMLIKK